MYLLTVAYCAGKKDAHQLSTQSGIACGRKPDARWANARLCAHKHASLASRLIFRRTQTTESPVLDQ